MTTTSAQKAMTAILLASMLLTGCATRPKIAPTPEPIAASENSQDIGQTVVRKSAMAAQAGVLFARSVHVDPVNRPVSNFLSLTSYALNSATGLLRRTALGTVQFPALEQQAIPEVAYASPMDLDAWERDLDRISGRKQTRGTVEFLIDGEEYFERMLEAVDRAEESIDIRTYIFDNDDYAVQVADVLKVKSKDVEVRVLVDAFGNMIAAQADPDSLPEGHVGPLHMGQYLEQDSKVKFRSRAIPWTTGDHTKTTIIDKKLAFIGGMNVGREYRYDWHDLMMEVTGPVVDHLQYDTDKAWARASVFGDVAGFFEMLDGEDKHADEHGFPLRVLYTATHDSEIYRAQLEAIRRARSYVLIENSYFSDDLILYELARARRRGVDVRVILPAEGNHGSHNESNRVAINKMLENGIRVYQYPGMSHVKAAVFDGWACVGSANFDKLSFQVNREVNLATSHQPVVNELLERLFIPDLARSTEITEELALTMQARIFEIVADEVM
ncbi:MAG: phosphatidylserine/phosphatidylglycerophosphate/cardiolipin synthase family protein [Woeseiaceae bacterium]|nr:phosphatidylserine/phosphatidylglycerophosphate/cardiolipin synthase family protein [Woeseiaceae bacterium]